MGHIRWSAVSVDEAMGQVEKEIEPIFEPLWRAAATARETMNLPNLPGYMRHALSGLEGEIHRVTGWNLEKQGSYLLSSINYVRRQLPEGAVEAERHATRHGKTESLFAPKS